MKFIGTRSFDFSIVLKHTGSSLPDLPVHVIVTPGSPGLVTIEVDAIDSALILGLVTRTLPEDHGVIAFSDDSDGWTPPAPPFSLRIRFDGRELDAHIAKLMSGAYALRIDATAPGVGLDVLARDEKDWLPGLMDGTLAWDAVTKKFVAVQGALEPKDAEL